MMQAHPFFNQLQAADFTDSLGYVRKVGPSRIEASGPVCAKGQVCEIAIPAKQDETKWISAEVVGIEKDHVILLPLEADSAILPNAIVRKSELGGAIGVGKAFAGRAMDALGRAIDGGKAIWPSEFVDSRHRTANAIERTATGVAAHTGIKAVDTLLTLSKGQRLGIFAPAGVGKTSLIAQLARQVDADRVVICLVGERGHEVRTIWEECRASERADRFTLVASTSDESAALRARAPTYALSLAQHWRAQGEHVLLLVDSMTRYAMALREIGLAAGEPPTLRAYTPNVFAEIPRFVEGCGALRSGGAITAIMTVLAEGEDSDDPLCEMMKSVLDGHILLSRALAEQGQFPAIDIGKSISRHAAEIHDPAQARLATLARRQLALYEESRIFVESGVYRKGSNPLLDRAIELRPPLNDFLAQHSRENFDGAEAFAGLSAILEGGK